MGALTSVIDHIPLKGKALAAQVAARLAIYGPLAGLAFFFMPWALPVLGLAVIEPLPTNLLLKGAQWVSEKVPVAGPVVKVGLNSWMGGKWWAHAGALEAALALLIPVHFIPWNLSRILVPALFLTAFPLATKYVHGFIEQIPWVQQRAMVKQQEAAERQRKLEGPSVPDAPSVSGVGNIEHDRLGVSVVQNAGEVDRQAASSSQPSGALSLSAGSQAMRLAGRPVAFVEAAPTVGTVTRVEPAATGVSCRSVPTNRPRAEATGLGL